MAEVVTNSSQDSKQIQTEQGAENKTGWPIRTTPVDELPPGRCQFGQHLVNDCVKISLVFHLFPGLTQI
jgi:hypothetical protein